jgi:hypothetical protein
VFRLLVIPVPVAVAQKTASDGDPPAVEAAESAKTKYAEKQNGGVAPSGASNATHHLFDKLV